MLGMAFALLHKDLRIVLSSISHFCQSILLGALLIFLFSLSKGAGETATPTEAATIFWLSSIFCQILIFGQLYAIEESNGAREALVLAPAPIQGVWLGKALAGFVLLFSAQLVFLPAVIVFLNQPLGGNLLLGAAGLWAVNLGIAISGALLGALGQGQAGRDALMSIIIFPLLVPLLMAGLNLGAAVFDPAGIEANYSWLGMALAYDAIFAAASLALFGFLYRGED